MNAFYHELFKMNKQQPIQIMLHEGTTNYAILEHWHRTIEIDYLIDCNADYWINGERIPAKAGNMIFINSGDVHAVVHEERNRVIEEGLHGASLFISYDFLKEICPDIDSISFQLQGNEEKEGELKELFDLLIKVYLSEQSEYSYLKLNSVVYRMLYLLFTYFKREKSHAMIKSQKYIDRLRSVMDYMDQNYAEPLSLQGVAKEFNVSTEYLAKIFKTYTGKTFKEYLNQVRLNRAFLEVIETDYSMLEIAMRNGFSDARSFNHIFRNEYGMTPFQYKKYYMESRRMEGEKQYEGQPHILVYEDDSQTE